MTVKYVIDIHHTSKFSAMKKFYTFLVLNLTAVLLSAQIPTNGLIAYYPFNGNAIDESGNGNNGTVSGATLTADRFGNPNCAYMFNGSSDYISINDTLCNFGTSDFTIASWINVNNYVSGSQIVFCKRNLNGYSNFVSLIVNFWKIKGEIDQSSPGDYSVVSSNSAVTLNSWYFATFVRQGNAIKLYFNANLEGTTTTPIIQNINNNAVTTIGRMDSDIAHFNGKIDDIRIYDRALTQSEILALYNDIQSPEGPIAWYPFLGNANDVSGNDNHGTVNGATLTADRFGNSNSAYLFDVNQNIITPFNLIQGNMSRTICAWVKKTTTSYNGLKIIYSLGYNNSGSLTMYTGLFHDVFQGVATDLAGARVTYQAIPDLAWHFYTWVFDNAVGSTLADVNIYKDGVLLTNIVESTGDNVVINTNGTLKIGDNNSNTMPLRGSIDDIKIYNRALTQAEILALFNETSTSTITLSADPIYGGSTMGGGDYQNGAQITVVADPSYKWSFLNWTENDSVVSDSNSYSFVVFGNRDLVANFQQSQPYAISTISVPANGGNTSGGGNYFYGDIVTVNATANTGWDFLYWTENGNIVSNSASYTFIATGDKTLEANFALQQFTITTMPFPTNGGTTTGDGVYYYGDTITVYANANPGYSFLYWTENGSIVSTSVDYIFTVTSNRYLIANFQAHGLDADFSAEPLEGVAPLTVQFTDESTGNPSVWIWDFQNDGVNDAFIQNPTFTYEEPGEYSVKLIVINTTETDTLVEENYILVNPASTQVGLVAYYPFNGNSLDESGNGHDGTVHGGAVLTSDRFGNENSAYYFDGNSGYIETANSTNLNFPQYSVSLWINFTQPHDGNIFSKNIAGVNAGFSVAISGSKIRYYAAGGDDMLSTADYNDGSWHHVATVFRGDSVFLYIDGNLDKSHSATGYISSAAQVLVGVTSSNFYHGKADEIRYYDKALTEEEVLELFNEDQILIPEICIVSVTPDEHNQLVWDKQPTDQISNYYIYRETTQTNVYELIGSVAYEDPGLFIDFTSNPQQRPYKYKISAFSSSGSETELSNYHRTIHLTINQGPTGWNLIWSPYEGFPFSTYYIYRGTYPNQLTLLDSISSSFTSYTDINPPWGPLYYAIEVVNENGCNPGKSGEYDRSRSNVQYNGVVGIKDDIAPDIYIYPNPAKDFLFIRTDEKITSALKRIDIYNLQGALMYSQRPENGLIQIQMQDYKPGIYILNIIGDDLVINKKIVVY